MVEPDQFISVIVSFIIISHEIEFLLILGKLFYFFSLVIVLPVHVLCFSMLIFIFTILREVECTCYFVAVLFFMGVSFIDIVISRKFRNCVFSVYNFVNIFLNTRVGILFWDLFQCCNHTLNMVDI